MKYNELTGAPILATPEYSHDGGEYGTCKECGANKVKNPKTGKIFCSNKCWLKKDVDKFCDKAINSPLGK